jgi:hypothetical protein
MSRAQISVDFIVIWSIVLIIFSVMIGIYVSKSNDLTNFAIERDGMDILADFSRNANFVHMAGNGGFVRIWLRPSLASGSNYTLRILGRRAELNWTYPGESVSEPLYFSGFNGSAVAVYLSAGKWTNLTNKGGIVYVSQG